MVTVVNNGLIAAAKRLVGVAAVNPMSTVQLGTGTTAEATDQTALVTPITDSGLAAVVGMASYEASYKGVVTATLGPASAGKTVTEVALKDSDGNMGIRHKYTTGRALDIGDSIVITFKITTGRPA